MNEMRLALEITLLGMGLVFGVLLLLWSLMSMLTAVTADKKQMLSETLEKPEDVSPVTDQEMRARAAAAAVALALAEQQASLARQYPEPPTAAVSPWQMGTRTRQLYQKGPIRRQGKIG